MSSISISVSQVRELRLILVQYFSKVTQFVSSRTGPKSRTEPKFSPPPFKASLQVPSLLCIFLFTFYEVLEKCLLPQIPTSAH